MTKKLLLSVLLILAIIAGFSFFTKISTNSPASSTIAPTAIPLSKQQSPPEDAPLISVVANNLVIPWALDFLPDKSILVTERPGRVRLITADGQLLTEPLLTLSVVQKIQGEGGLHGVAVHPDFLSNHFVYLYYTYENNNQQSKNRVARYTLENNKLTGETIIVDEIPGALFHDGGRIKFGPDKLLYITTGDSQDPSLAQNTNSTAGKILRVTAEGKPAPNNPFNTLVYSYGHRNPQGIAWDANGTLWQTEHGRSSPTGYDEVNLIEPGKNYGWDTIQGDEIRAGMVTPKRNSGPSTAWAPAGAAFVENSLFFAGLRGETLYEAVTQNNTVIDLKEHFKGQFGRLREVVVGPDGMLYVTTSNRDGRGLPKAEDDKIFRINPAKLQ